MRINNKIISLLGLLFLIGLMAIVNDRNVNYPVKNSVMPSTQLSLEVAIEEGFQNGEIALLYPHFDELISICINDKEDIYLAYNAKTALQNFFHAFPPDSFKIKHKGISKRGGTRYFIGDYLSESKEQFKIYLFLENDLINEIEISEQSITS